MAEQSLKDKTVKGVAWSTIDSVAHFGVTFIVSIVLARLLTPDDYGLIGIIMIVTTVCTTIINGGFTTALIRKKDATDDDYNTVFITNLSVSLVLYAIIFVCSPLIAKFFYRPELTRLTQVSAIGLIIGALSLVQQTRLTKRIDFKTQTKITIVATIGSGIIGISMALLNYGVWALVAQTLSVQFFKTTLLWIYNKWMPRLRFSSQSFHELFGFGWKMMLSTLLDTVWKELYQVVVGKFYSPATLGQYTRSKQFSAYLSKDLTLVIQRVTYPVLSNLQDDKERMVAAYRRIIKTTMFVTAIGMFMLGAISEPLLYCLIGPKWHEAATYLPLICISGSLYPLHAINLNMLKVQGRSDLFLGLEIIKKIIGVGPLLIGAFIGIFPMLYASLLTGIIAYFLNSYYSGKLLGYSSWMQLRDIAPSYIIAGIVAVPVFFLKYVSLTYWAVLPIQFVVGVMLVILIANYTANKEFKEVISIIKPYIQKRKRQTKKGYENINNK